MEHGRKRGPANRKLILNTGNWRRTQSTVDMHSKIKGESSRDARQQSEIRAQCCAGERTENLRIYRSLALFGGFWRCCTSWSCQQSCDKFYPTGIFRTKLVYLYFTPFLYTLLSNSFLFFVRFFNDNDICAGGLPWSNGISGTPGTHSNVAELGRKQRLF